jgi:hypothetical protein
MVCAQGFRRLRRCNDGAGAAGGKEVPDLPQRKSAFVEFLDQSDSSRPHIYRSLTFGQPPFQVLDRDIVALASRLYASHR